MINNSLYPEQTFKKWFRKWIDTTFLGHLLKVFSCPILLHNCIE
jgi:hypothetical protein